MKLHFLKEVTLSAQENNNMEELKNWKPISDAPKDGEAFYTHDGAHPVIAAWCSWSNHSFEEQGPCWNRKKVKVEKPNTEGWYAVYCERGKWTASHQIFPTVWRSLPKMPWECIPTPSGE